MYHPDSLLFAPPVQYVDPSYPYYTTEEVLDCSWMDPVSWGLEGEECHLDQLPVEVVYDAEMLMEENGILSPLFAGEEEWSQLEVGHVGGQLWLGSEEDHDFVYEQQQLEPSSPMIHF